jgi:hypothetical protein
MVCFLFVGDLISKGTICTGQKAAIRKKARKQFFFEKKNQKTFVCWGILRGRGKIKRQGRLKPGSCKSPG